MSIVFSSQKNRVCKRRGREGSYPPSPRTDPGVRNYRTGLFRQSRFRRQQSCLCYSPQGGLPCFTGPACPGKVSFVGYDCLSAPSPCERLSRPRWSGGSFLRVLWADPTPDRLRLSYLIFRSAYLLSQERIGSPKFLCVSLDTCHALCGPRQTFGKLTNTLSLCWLLGR